MTFRILAFLSMVGCFYFFILQCFFWGSPASRRVFGLSIDFSERTKKFGLMMGAGFFCLGLHFVFGFTYLYQNVSIGVSILTFCSVIGLIVGLLGTFTFGIRFFIFLALPSLLSLIFA